MLETLHIRNLATVPELEVFFVQGLNVLSGETGAGKSIILGAIQNLLGARAEKSLIRKGAASCEVTGFFRFANGCGTAKEVERLLSEIGAPEPEAGQLILRRVITDSGSRAYINSSPVTLQVLRQLGDILVDIHGPNDHQSLLRPACQLNLLDTFGSLLSRREQCESTHRDMLELTRRLETLYNENLSPAEAELLRHQLNEIDAANLQSDEEESLTERHRIVSHARRIIEICQQCQRGLNESDNSITEQLGEYVRLLREIAEIDPQHGGELLQRLEDIYMQLQDLGGDLESFGDGLELDQKELHDIEERLDLIQRLRRKHGGDVEKILEHAEILRERLDSIDSRERNIEEIRLALETIKNRYRQICLDLSRGREKAARQLAAGIAAKLKGLGFEQSHFEIILTKTNPGPHGEDRIEFCFAPNPGEEMQPLRKIASSGEISRVMLAIKTVLSAVDQVPVLLFDEVDANIGGRIALSVADELAGLSASHQILCISHLPQIAARAARHFEVGKVIENQRTVTHIVKLDEEGRINELSRMMGAAENSKAARHHALEMLRKQGHRK